MTNDNTAADTAASNTVSTGIGNGLRTYPMDIGDFTLDGLDADLRQFVVPNGPLGPLFDHPLHRDIRMLWTANRPEMEFNGYTQPAGLESINEIIRSKRDCLAEARAIGDWESYIFNHHRPYRIDALVEVIEEIGIQKLWPLVGYVWTDSNSVTASADEWQWVWDHCYSRRGGLSKRSRLVMSPEDRRACAALPDEFTIYRGCRFEDHAESFSWSLDRKVAVWFAHRRDDGQPLLVTTQISRSQVLAYFSGRKEAEIVLDPNTFWDIHIERLPCEDLSSGIPNSKEAA
jgi:hypothetical protein